MIEAINEISEDVKYSIEKISDQATEHIHADEVILTLGRSKTVEEFLKVKIFKIHLSKFD